MVLTKDNYYQLEAGKEYMSVSQFKDFEKCESYALAKITGDWIDSDKKAFQEGRFGEFVLLNDSEEAYNEYLANNKELAKKGGELYANFDRIKQNAERVKKDSFFMSFLKGDQQQLLTADIAGVKVKGLLDILADDKIVDIKFIASFDDIYDKKEKRYKNFAEAYQYDIQGAVYRELVRQATGKTLPFYLACITKETTADFNLFEIPAKWLDTQLEYFKEKAKHYNRLKNGSIKEAEACMKCEYCKSIKSIVEPEILHFRGMDNLKSSNEEALEFWQDI